MSNEKLWPIPDLSAIGALCVLWSILWLSVLAALSPWDLKFACVAKVDEGS